MCSIFRCIDSEAKTRKKESVEATLSFNFSVEIKDVSVRIVHAGRREEVYHSPIPASQLMQKYPGMCIASPDIFKHPHGSIISADDVLVPGQKYFLVPCTTVWKLKRKSSQKKKGSVARLEGSILAPKAVVADWEKSAPDSKQVSDVEDFSLESVASAKNYYISREEDRPIPQVNKSPKRKPFVPPIEKPRTWKEYDWEPSLNSIEEISP